MFVCKAALGLQKIEQVLQPVPIYFLSLCPLILLFLTSWFGVLHLSQLMNQYWFVIMKLNALFLLIFTFCIVPFCFNKLSACINHYTILQSSLTALKM